MAKIVSLEIKTYFIQEGYTDLSKLSFIGFSLGGVVIRAMFPYLKQYHSRFFFLATFNTPHLGISFSQRSFVEIGLWLLKTVTNKNSSASQLKLEDKEEYEDTFIYKLSEDPKISHFQYIYLISSESDSYVRKDSAFIFNGEIVKSLSSSKRKVFQTMISNILNNINADYVSRIHVPFVDTESDFDSFIGKKSHISIIGNKNAIYTIMNSMCSVFEK